MSILKSPEARTEELWSLDVRDLGQELRHRTVTIPGTDTSIVLMEFKPYLRAENETWLYRPMQGMEAGYFWARYHPLRKMCLSLIVAKEDGVVGACLQVTKASRIDLVKGNPVNLPKQGDAAEYLGLTHNEIGKLRFLDHSEVLYLIPSGRIVDKVIEPRTREMISEAADQALGRLLG